jgi:uncharacterized protein (TIGR02266 family)
VEHRRADRRYDRRIPIEFSHEGRPYSADTVNISLGGLFIGTDIALPMGSKVALKFRVPTQNEHIEVEAVVRWVESEDGRVIGLGVRFEGLRARDVWALNKYLEQPGG